MVMLLGGPSRLILERDRRSGGRAGSGGQGSAAVGAELVGMVHGALAERADGPQAGAAAGTEAEAGLDLGIALRTVSDARFAQNEIEDDAETVGDKDGNKRPQQAAHAAASGVLVDVADQDGVATEHGAAEDAEEAANGKRRGFAIEAYDGHNKHSHGHEDGCE